MITNKIIDAKTAKQLNKNVVNKELKHSEFSTFLASKQFLSLGVIAIMLGVAVIAGVIEDPSIFKAQMEVIAYTVNLGGTH